MPHPLLKRLWISLACLPGLVFAPAGQAVPLGDPVMVNTDTAGNQTSGLFAAGFNGEKLLIWRDGAANATYAQRIKSSGSPFLTKQQIQLPPTYSKLSVDRTGNFVLAGQTGISGMVMAYDRSGNLLSNFSPTPDSLNAAASMDTDGNMTVAYSYPNVFNVPRNLAIRRFNTSGTPIGPEIIVATGPVDTLSGPNSIATDSAGNIALLWTSRAGSSAPAYSVMQRFSRAGVALTPVIVASHASTGVHMAGSIAMEPGGKSVVVWTNAFPNGSNSTYIVYARAFDANGNPTGNGSTRVNQSLVDFYSEPTAAIAENGDFVVSWVAPKGVIGGGPDSALAARQFHGDGTPITNESRVDPPLIQPASSPHLAMDPVGNFAVAWTSGSPADGPGTGWDAMVRTFKMDTRPPITQLVDNRAVQGLAGDTGSWSYYRLTVPPGVRQLNIDMTGPVGGGDGDMYVRFGGLPSLTAWDQRPYVNGSNESVGISNPPPGDVYIGIHGRSAYASIGLTAGYYYP
ncbi:PPC domain-containing protein [Variovorax sp. 770b2]|uniref:PPC domain-containing protein n=1 Tax=Variovorax sp. 770b2 TaxID=1566271 RepID=UPI0008EE2CDE|nr:pre-peptidase C-terminal domain-containing protein [Variovorax sp. 770b2]SFQ11827.1 pre-peptidase C-terminal domain-containing protein [Variovorax sp. 770b2]